MGKNTFILILVMVVVFANQSFSMEKRPPLKKMTTTKALPEILKITGKVSSYSWSNSTITVSANSGDSIVISVDKNTQISKAKKSIKLSDIRNGDYVTVRYEARKGTNIAKSIVGEDKKSSLPTKNKR